MQDIHWRPIAHRVAGTPALVFLVLVIAPSPAQPQDTTAKDNAPSSYDQIAPVLLGKESFQTVMAKDKADKDIGHGPPEEAAGRALRPVRPARQEGHDVARQADPGRPDREAAGGDDLGAAGRDVAAMRFARRDCSPRAFCRCPTPSTRSAAWSSRRWRSSCSPRLERFDLDFDLPEHFLPEFPPAIFLTTRPDLGDVSQGKVVTVDNFQELFAGILNAKDLEGLRLLVTQFPQQQFNATADRKTEKPIGMQGVACFDCHVNGHTSGATHLVGRHPAADRTAAGSTRRACAASTSSGCSARSGL